MPYHGGTRTRRASPRKWGEVGAFAMNNLPNNVPPWPAPERPRPLANTPNTPSAPNVPERMPTAEARSRAKVLKRVALAGTTLAFCALGGLAASHVTGVTAASGSGSTPATAPSNQDDHGGFFSGDGRGSDDGNSVGSGQNQSGGFNFGSGGTIQPPAASSGGS